MEILKVTPPHIKTKKYLFKCKPCKAVGPVGLEFDSSEFIAEYPKDFLPGLFGNYCICPRCGDRHYLKGSARLRYLFYKLKKRW